VLGKRRASIACFYDVRTTDKTGHNLGVDAGQHPFFIGCPQETSIAFTRGRFLFSSASLEQQKLVNAVCQRVLSFSKESST